MHWRRPTLAILALAALWPAFPARAEVAEVRLATQYGLAFLPLMVAEDRKLIEKHAARQGLPGLKVTWARFSGSNTMNDALLSGSLDIAAGGVPGLATLWAKTRGTLDVRGVAALDSMPAYLNSRNPDVRTLHDFTGRDRIAVPGVKISPAAIMLQIAVAKEFGEADYARLDPLTVSLSHPDAMTALLSPASEISAHLASPPYQYQELQAPGIHRVLSSNEIMGGNTTFGIVWATGKFHDRNPKTYQAVFDALAEAMDIINADKAAAARTYLAISGEKFTPAEIAVWLNDPETEFTITPRNVLKLASFMYRVGTIKVEPLSWRDLFFDAVHGANGS